MTIEAITAVSSATGTGAAAGAGGAQAGYGVSLTDVAGFDQAMQGAAARIEAQPAMSGTQAMQGILKPLESVNGEAERLSAAAEAAQAGDKQMTPGDIISLTVQSSEFMFHCQLTSNIANRTSDGLQQLFRQQS